MYLQNEVDVAQLADMHAQKNAWKTRRILKQTINASNLKASLWSIALAPDPGALSLLQHHWQWCVNYLYAFTQDMAPRFGNVYIHQSTQKEGRKMECKENSKDKLIHLAELHWILNIIQRNSIPLIHKYIKQVITIGTASKLETILNVQKAGGVNTHDDPRARQSSETERKMVNAFPASHHITALQLKIELRFLNFQPRTSNILQYFLLEEQQQLQTKLSRTCQVWWWWCKLFYFFAFLFLSFFFFFSWGWTGC